MSSTKVDKIVKTYRSLSQIPALAGARLSNNGTIIKSVWTQRNLDKGKSTKFQRMHILQNFVKIAEVPPVDISSELMRSTSKSEKFQCVVRENDGKQYLEIWTNDNLSRCVDLKALDIHGDIYTDGEFGSLEFSPDEKKVIYVAELKPPKTEPFIKRKNPDKPENNGDASNTKDEIIKGQEYVFRQDWGEQLVNKKQSTLVQYDIESDTFDVIKGIPEGVCPAKPIWSENGKSIVGIAYKSEPRKLGLIYCTNRLSTVFQIDFEENYVELNLENKSIKEPRLTPDGLTLIWLQRSANGPHAACMSLMKTNFPITPDSAIDNVVDIVPNQIDIDNNRIFYGLYNQGFPNRCWASNRRVLLSTNQQNTIDSYVINIDTGCITKLEGNDGSLIILDVQDDVVLASWRNIRQKDVLVIGKIPETEEFSINWEELTDVTVINGLETYNFEYLDVVQPEDDIISKNSTAIYFGPQSAQENSYPLIVWPHGGPHSAFANYFFLEAGLFASLGYAMLFINYRGSIGTGQTSVDFLLGRVGISDVADCISATEKILEKHQFLNKEKVVLMGGSHGGFLVTHLSGQRPDMFKAVVARNPVIDIASMSVISDIPDWCYVEAGYDYNQIGEPDHKILLRMRELSPIMHAHKVKAPTLLQIGSKDLRVPMHQALEYYYRLKSNGIKVKMNLYDDNHPLGNVTNEVDNLINGALWFEEHINGTL
ncbi:acylamino-acid-releasing enzyme-like isoform X1 [Onthophagus taurus]|uniref:acylamino-acid-releasing enzyme-like isoform X1 n=1 Tax=Onthophagus taurus TaxID=166361 RepID=UPI0039BE8690